MVDDEFGFPDEVDEAGQVHEELGEDCEDGIHIEDVGQGTLLRENCQRLKGLVVVAVQGWVSVNI